LAAAEPIARLKRQMETGAACLVMTLFLIAITITRSYASVKRVVDTILELSAIDGRRLAGVGEELLVTMYLDRIDDPQDVPTTKHGLLPGTLGLVSGIIALVLVESLT
jgi:hypothetical protein